MRRLPFTLNPTSYALRTAPNTLHPTPCTLHPAPYTLHPTPFPSHPTPYTLHPAPYTLNSRPFTLHPACTLTQTLTPHPRRVQHPQNVVDTSRKARCCGGNPCAPNLRGREPLVLWCRVSHVILIIWRQRYPRTPPCRKVSL